MRRIFFKKKIKVIYSTTTIQENKKYFSTCLLFHFLLLLLQHNKAINTVFYFNCLLFSLERCQEKIFKNILSLLAGKSEQICTAFPLTTISAQKIIRFFFKTFSCSKNSKSFLTNLTALKNIHHLAFLNFSRENLLAEKLVNFEGSFLPAT